jgi:hypothetical protein
MGIGVAMAQQMGSMFSSEQSTPSPAAAPPPLPASQRFFVAVGGQQTGPFGLDGLSGEKAAGRLTEDSLVWSKGMSNWQKASTVAVLAELFEDDAPPPLPPL